MKKFYTVFDYLEWRGDLTFSKSPLNEVDSLILSMCVFLNFSGIVPSFGSDETITLPDAVERFCKMPESFRDFGVLVPGETQTLASVASHCARFRGIRLSNFVNRVDEKREMQFCAVTYHLPDGSLFIAFRGTDDTLVGWKEDMDLSYRDYIPAQAEAVSYTEHICELYPGKVRLAGHSKGGNLALYTAVHARHEVRDRLVMAYSHDGPGFQRHILESDRYREMQEKLITFIPQSSIVGVVLDHDDHYHIISSAGSRLFQHDPFSWEIHGTSFVYLRERSGFGKRTARAIRAWLAALTNSERAFFAETFYRLLQASHKKTLSDINRDRLRTMKAAHKELRKLDASDRSRFHGILKSLVSHLNQREAKPAPAALGADASDSMIGNGKTVKNLKNEKIHKQNKNKK